MDERAQRHAHNRMVAVTCQPEAQQSFLVTPKSVSLLPSLGSFLVVQAVLCPPALCPLAHALTTLLPP